jgi:hypothetical protein
VLHESLLRFGLFFYIEVGNEVSAKIFNLFAEQNYIAVSPEGEVLKGLCTFNTFFIPIENEKAQKYAGVLELVSNSSLVS